MSHRPRAFALLGEWLWPRFFFSYGNSGWRALGPVPSATPSVMLLAAILFVGLELSAFRAFVRSFALSCSSVAGSGVAASAYQWESEVFDLPTLDLAPEQNKLIETVTAANPKTIVVLETGSPATMPWIDKVSGVIEAWYPGIRVEKR